MNFDVGLFSVTSALRVAESFAFCSGLTGMLGATLLKRSGSVGMVKL